MHTTKKNYSMSDYIEQIESHTTKNNQPLGLHKRLDELQQQLNKIQQEQQNIHQMQYLIMIKLNKIQHQKEVKT